jgi:hypothetical protein
MHYRRHPRHREDRTGILLKCMYRCDCITMHITQHNVIDLLIFSYSSQINGYLYNRRVSPPLNKSPAMLSESKAAHPVGCDRPLLTVMVHQKAISICRGLSHPTRSHSRIVCRGQERHQGRKGTLRPDF